MSTISKVIKPTIDTLIRQGDIFSNVRYSYINSEDDENVEIEELVFPMAIVISQSCDVSWADDSLSLEKLNPSKYMPAVLMCPIYNYEELRRGTHLQEIAKLENCQLDSSLPIFNSKDKDVAEKDWHYRLHILNATDGGGNMFEGLAVDFKHYFTVPVKYLHNNKQNRIYSLESIYAEQIALKFATFLSRVGIPDEPNVAEAKTY